MKSYLRSESCKRKFSIILFVHTYWMLLGKKNRENYWKEVAEQRSKENPHEINPGLALLRLRTAGLGIMSYLSPS